MRDLIGFTYGNSLRAHILRQKKILHVLFNLYRGIRVTFVVSNLALLLFSHAMKHKNDIIEKNQLIFFFFFKYFIFIDCTFVWSYIESTEKFLHQKDNCELLRLGRKKIHRNYDMYVSYVYLHKIRELFDDSWWRFIEEY